jgi:outer membrane protein assembly factor BamB
VTHGSCDTQLLALDAETGSQLWYYTDPNFGFMNAPTIANGLVYYSFENTLHALNLYNGTQVWSAPGVASWNPVIAEHRIYKVSSTYSALNASTGTQDWISHFHLPRASDSTITYDQGVLYSWMDGVFRAINPRTGGLIWSLTIDPDMVGWASQMPLIVGRIAIVGTAYPQKIYAINLDTRQIRSVVPENAHGSGEPFLAVADGFVYSVSGQLNAYNLDSGNMLWSFTVSGFNETLAWNPIVTQKYIYVASGGPPSNTYVLDRTTHQVVWQTDAGGYLTVADGYLYITAVAEYTHVRTIRAYQAQEP